MAVAVVNHTVTVTVGDDATLSTDGDLVVSGGIEQAVQVVATGEATRNTLDQGDASDTTGRGDIELGVGIGVVYMRNTVDVTLGGTSDASGSTDVGATVAYPFRIDGPEGALNPAVTVAEEGLDGFEFLLDGTLGFASELFNVQVSALAGDPGDSSADKLAIGLGLGVLVLDNDATATIDADVNQRADLQTSTQSVAVTAGVLVQLVEVAHNSAFNLSVPGLLESGTGFAETFKKQGFGTSLKGALRGIVNPFGVSGQAAIGPALLINVMTNDATAEILDGARVRTGDDGDGLAVTSTTEVFDVAVAQTGTKASDFGLTVSLTVGVVTDTAKALVREGVTLVGGPVAVSADDTIDRIGIAGAFVTGEQAGVGISVGVNVLTRTVQASIGRVDLTADPGTAGTSIDSAGDVTVSATTGGSIFVLTIGGALQSSADPVPPAPGTPPPTSPPADSNDISAAFAISVAVNIQDANDVDAYLDGVTLTDADSVSVTADNRPEVLAIVIAAAFAVDKPDTSNRPVGGATLDLTLAGAVAVNDFASDVGALIGRSSVTGVDTGGVSVGATDHSTIQADGGGLAVAINLAGKTPGSKNRALSISVGVSFAINDIENTTTANIDDSVIGSVGDVRVDAESESTITALTIAGSLSASTTAGQTQGTSISLSGAGAGSGNNIENTVEALISNSAVTSTAGGVAVTASDMSTINADAGGVAVAITLGTNFTNISVGLSVALNEIDNEVTAAITGPGLWDDPDDGTDDLVLDGRPTVVTAGGTLTDDDPGTDDAVLVSATSDATIEALTIGGAAGTGAGAGAGSGNEVTTVVTAEIAGAGQDTGSATVTGAGGDVRVLASDTSRIDADAGAGALALSLGGSGTSSSNLFSVSVGISVAINEIAGSSVTAAIRGARVTAGRAATADLAQIIGKVVVSATSDARINALAIAASLGVAAGGSGSSGFSFNLDGAGVGSKNDVDVDVVAEIDDSDVTAVGGDVEVEAISVPDSAGDEPSIYAVAVGATAGVTLSGGGTGVTIAIGLAIALNAVTGSTTAGVVGSTVVAGGSVLVSATSRARIIATTVGVNVGGTIGRGTTVTGGGAGAGSGNEISRSIKAWTSMSSLTASGGSITVEAEDDSVIDAVAVGVSVSVGISAGGSAGVSISVGIAAADNEIDNTVEATVSGGVVDAATLVKVTSLATSSITAWTVAVGVAVTVNTSGVSVNISGAGAGSGNRIGNEVTAVVSGGAGVDARNGDATVSASDTSTILARAIAANIGVGVGAQGGTISLAAAIALNEIGFDDDDEADGVNHHVVRAAIDGSAVTASDNVYVTSDFAADIDSITVGVAISVQAGSGSFSLAGAGAGSNSENTIGAEVTAEILGAADVDATAGNVEVRATDRSSASADSGTGAASVSVSSSGASISGAIGVSLATNTIENTVTASIRGSSTDAATGDVTPTDVDAGAKVVVEATSAKYDDPDTTDDDDDDRARALGVAVSVAVAVTNPKEGVAVGLSGAGVGLTNTVENVVVAEVASGADVTGGTGVEVTADDTTVSSTEVVAVSVTVSIGIGVSVGGATTDDTISTTVDARISGATVTATTGDVVVDADTTHTVDTDITVASVAIAVGGSGAGATAEGTIDGHTQAGILGASSVTASAGAVNVTADSTQTVTAENEGGSGTIAVAINVFYAYGTASAPTRAVVDGTASVTADSMLVQANATVDVDADILAVGIAGGLAGSGGAVEATVSGEVEARVGTDDDVTPPSTLGTSTVDGHLEIRAWADLDAKANARAGSGSIVGSAAGGESTATVSAPVRAYVGATTLTAGRLTATTRNADDVATDRYAEAKSEIGSVALLTGSGSTSTAEVTGLVEAFVDSGANVTVSGPGTLESAGLLALDALAVNTAFAEAKGGSGGGIAISIFFAEATVGDAGSSATRAWVGGGTTVDAGSISVTATSTDTADADLLTVGVGLVSGADGDADAVVDLDVEAWVGSTTSTGSATTVDSAGQFDVIATSKQAADADVDGGAGGVVAVSGGLTAEATVESTTRAFIGYRVSIPTSGNLTVRAEVLEALALTDNLTGTGGGVAVGVASATSTASPTVSAYVADGTVIGSVDAAGEVTGAIDGDVTVQATGRAEADAWTQVYGGGVIEVGVPNATVDVDPDVDAYLGATSGTSTTVIATRGSVTVRAELLAEDTSGEDPPSDLIQSVSVANQTLTFTFDLPDGSTVQYEAGSDPITDLVDGEEYTLIDAGTNLVRLGTVFDAAYVDGARDTILLPAGHPFTTGDQVVYNARLDDDGNPNDSIFEPDQTTSTLYVVVIDDITIKLRNTASAGPSATATSVNTTDDIVNATNTFAEGQAVTYRAGDAVTVTPDAIDVAISVVAGEPTPDSDTSGCPGDPCGVVQHVDANDNILVKNAGSVFTAGQAVTVVVIDGSLAGTNLSTTSTYYVIRSGLGTHEIKLASSYCTAVGGAGDTSCTYDHDSDPETPEINIEIAPISISSAADGVYVLQSAIGPLTSGVTYYVRNPTGSGFQLSGTPTGPILELSTVTFSGNSHTFAVEGLDLRTGTGRHELAVFLTDTGNGRLLGPGGIPLADIVPTPSDGTSKATTNGGGGGVGSFRFPTADATSDATVDAEVRAATVSAGVDVLVAAVGEIDISASADAAGGGVVDAGDAHADTVADVTTTTVVGGSTEIVAGRDVTVSSTSEHTVFASARSVGGGAITGKVAETTAAIDNDTVTQVEGGAIIAGGRHVRVLSSSGTDAETDSETYAVGVGAGADSDNTNDDRGVTIGTFDFDDPDEDELVDAAVTHVLVGDGAVIEGETVDLHAKVDKLRAKANADSTSYNPVLFGVATAFSDAEVDIWSDVDVQIAGSASTSTTTLITGQRGVDVQATYDSADVNIERRARRLAVALIFPQQSRTLGFDKLDATVLAQPGVIVTAARRDDGATGDSGLTTSSAQGVGGLALFAEAFYGGTRTSSVGRITDDAVEAFDHIEESIRTTSRTITWDSDVVISAGPSPELVVGVDAAGDPVIVRAVNVTVDGVFEPAAGTGIVGDIDVGDIYNDNDTGDIVMEAYSGTIGQASSSPVGSHFWGTFYFRTSFDEVRITNESDADLVLGNIDLVNTNDDPEVHLRTRTSAGSSGSVTVEFDLVVGVEPALLDIKSLGSGDIRFTGTGLTAFSGAAGVENPIGETRVLAVDGDITQSSSAVEIRTNRLGDPTAPVLPKDFERMLLGDPDVVFTGELRFTDNGTRASDGTTVADTITRTDGQAWTTIGVGDLIKITDSASNDGAYQVAAVSGSVLTLSTLAALTGETSTVTLTPFWGMEATAGTIGTFSQPIRVQLVEAPSLPEHAFVVAGEYVWLDVQGRKRTGAGSFEVLVDHVHADDDATVVLQAAVLDGAATSLPAVDVYVPSEYSGSVPYDDFFRPDTSTDNRAASPPNTGAYAAVGSATATAATYRFGLIEAGSNIDVDAGDATATATRVNIVGNTNILAGGDFVDAKTNGWITLSEIDAVDPADPDDLRIGLIWSTDDDVSLTAFQDLVDADEGPVVSDAADVIGVNIFLFSRFGSIGRGDDFLEIDLLGAYRGGNLTAYALDAVYVEETDGDLRVDVVTTSNDLLTVDQAPSYLPHVTLATRDGWILNGAGDASGNVIAVEVELYAVGDGPSAGSPTPARTPTGGGIGLLGLDFYINSSSSGLAGAGYFYGQATHSIYVTEIADELNVLGTTSHEGHVRLTVPDTDLPRGPPGTADEQPQDIVLLTDGAIQIVQAATTTTVAPSAEVTIAQTRAGIWAKLDIHLWAGDDVTAPARSEIVAGGTIVIRGDTNRIAGTGGPSTDTPSGTAADDDDVAGDPKDGWGTTITLAGTVGGVFDLDGLSLDTDITYVLGNIDVDTFLIDQAYLGATTRVYGSHLLPGAAGAPSDDGEDRFTVDRLQTMNVAGVETLTLDGQADTDTYTVKTTGSQGARRDYIINVLDTGAEDDGEDRLSIHGRDSPTSGTVDDIFLLRRASFIPTEDPATNETAVDPAFVALLHGDLDQARADDPTGDAAIRPQEVQRINYDSAVNGRLEVFGFGGDDVFAVDDNSSITSLDGGDGNDLFQIGQLYGSRRTEAQASLAARDVFPELVPTTRGWLSPGISVALVAQGGAGDDTFTVYSNQAELRLEGDDGNDLFVVRAFALALVGTDGEILLDEDGVAVPDIGGTSTAEETTVRPGGGDDEVRYNVNAPVSIDGGSGFDKVVVLGTEFPDDIVISVDGIFGAGVNVRYDNVEVVEVDGLEGDDEFFVISTPFGVATRVIGGLGSDTINVGGDVVEDIQVKELEGVSGLVNHGVTSTADEGYDGLLAAGLDLNVANPAVGVIVIDELGGVVVREGGPGAIDGYRVSLFEQPDATVYVTVSAARASSSEPGAETILLATGSTMPTSRDAFVHNVWVNGSEVEVVDRALVLVFTPGTWSTPQYVWVFAEDDTASEGERTVAVGHSVISDDDTFDGSAVRNVEVRVLDDDRPGVVVTELGAGGTADTITRVLEGPAPYGSDDSLTVELTTRPSAKVVVEVTLSDGQATLTSANSRFTPTPTGGMIEFLPDDWDDAVLLTVTATPDSRREDPHITVATFSVGAGTLDAGFTFDDQLLDIEVLDDDTPGVIVEETGGDTVLTPTTGDDYTIRLTSAPNGPVTIHLLTDGQVDVGTVRGVAPTIAVIGTAVDGGWFSGSVVFDAATRTLTRADGGDWVADGFLEGQLVRITGGANAGDHKVELIYGTNNSVLRLTTSSTLTSATAAVTVARIAAVVTFDATNWWVPAVIGVVTDTDFVVPESRLNTKEFAVEPHLLSDLRGPLAVEGGATSADRSLVDAILLPGEDDAPLIEIGAQPDEAQQIDVLNVFDDSSQESKQGTLTATALQGLGMAGDLDFGGPTAFGEPTVFPGGISFGVIDIDADGNWVTDASTTTIEVLNVLLGSGNDRLLVQSTLVPADEGGAPAVHGGITLIHGGGNSYVLLEDAEVAVVDRAGGDALVRLDGVSWADAGFAVGQRIVVVAGPNAGTYDIVGLADGPRGAGTVLVTTASLAAGTESMTVRALDPDQSGDTLVGGDHITITGGAGPGSPLVVFGDTSQSGVWYSGSTSTVAGQSFGLKPFDAFPDVVDEDQRWEFPLADAFDLTGNDVVDASALFAGAPAGALPAIGLVIYGGPGDDVLIGSQAGDVIAGGSGDDLLIGGRGADLVYGDSGVEVDVLSALPVVFSGSITFGTDGAGNGTLTRSDGGSFVADGFTTGEVVSVLGGRNADQTAPQIGNGGDFVVVAVTASTLAVRATDGSAPGLNAGAALFVDIGFGTSCAERTAGCRILSVPTSEPRPAVERPDNADDLVPGDDLVFGDAGPGVAVPPGAFGEFDDVVFGDHGAVIQGIPAEARVLTVGVIDRLETREPSVGGDDVVSAGLGLDRVFGGNGDDLLRGEAERDILIGDHGAIDYVVADGDRSDADVVTTTDPTLGGDDTIEGGEANDVILGGTAADTVAGGTGNDLIFGDHGRLDGDIGAAELARLPFDEPLVIDHEGFVLLANPHPIVWTSIDTSAADGGSVDLLRGNEGDDVILGGQAGDLITGGTGDDDIIGGHNVPGGNDGDDIVDGGAGDDIVAGDNADILRTGDVVGPRMRVLDGEVVFAVETGAALVTGLDQADPRGAIVRHVTLFDHVPGADPATHGDDTIAGGADDDVIFGQLGDDWIQGDGATIDDDGVLVLDVRRAGRSAEDWAGTGTDGDDYVEGNGGDDTIFGNLGQDDLVGDNSDLFSLATPAQRTPVGSDTIFGGAGTRLERNDTVGCLCDGTSHALDADVILGDNGSIFRLVGTNGTPLAPSAFLRFNHDLSPAGARYVVPRAYTLLDYTQGGAAGDLGAADLLHGERGDDTVHGMTGDDVAFGEDGDDDIYGGTGNDRLYGGEGIDGILGDDGKVLTSRNGLTEPLNRLTVANGEVLYDIPGPFIGALEFLTGELTKAVDLAAWELGGADVIYGGNDADFLHGGAGDDAISGAEATRDFYTDVPQDAALLGYDPANPLGYDPVTRKLAAYDADNPRPRIAGFLLNFDAWVVDEATGLPVLRNGQLVPRDDGKDRIFGDMGNDWLVGGTNFDRMFGGLGDDLMNADDNHETNGGLNDGPELDGTPDTTSWFAQGDFAFGGAGLDVLIGNAARDRLFDWTGEFNSFVVPFSPFGSPTVNRRFSPFARDFLRNLSFSSGADTTTLVEPIDELALVEPQDDLWNEQHGGPRDPQPGNIPGVQRDDVGGPEVESLPDPCDILLVVEKSVNAADPLDPTGLERADDAPGRRLELDEVVVWTYQVWHLGEGEVELTGILDDHGTPLDTLDDFVPVLVGGDTDGDRLLDAGEVWLFTSAGVVSYRAVPGEYANRVVVTGTDAATGQVLTAVDASHHFVGVLPAIRVEKAINASDPTAPTPTEDADTPATRAFLLPGTAVTWTYLLVNEGRVELRVVEVLDDGGTPGDTADDFTPRPVLDAAGFNVGDVDHDRLLDPGETWRYTSDGVLAYVVAGDYANVAGPRPPTSAAARRCPTSTPTTTPGASSRRGPRSTWRRRSTPRSRWRRRRPRTPTRSPSPPGSTSGTRSGSPTW